MRKTILTTCLILYFSITNQSIYKVNAELTVESSDNSGYGVSAGNNHDSSTHTLSIKNNTCHSNLQDSENENRILKSSNEQSSNKKLKMYLPEQVEFNEKYLYSFEEFQDVYSLSEVENIALNLKLHGMVYNDFVEHNYENYRDLAVAGGTEVNQELCLDELRELIERTRRFSLEKHSSKDVNLHQLLDTFGKSPSGVLLGELTWTGSYKGCQMMQIRSDARGARETRFCFAQFKQKRKGPINVVNDILALKIGVCLPKTCDSIKYKDKFQLIQTLVEFNMRDVDKGERVLASLYCLPDEQSPLRVWWKAPKTLVTVIIFAAWIMTLVYSTIKFKKLTAKQKELDEEGASDSQFQYLEIYRSLSIINNFKNLFKTGSQRSVKQELNENELGEQFKVDLGLLDGLKVLGMSYVITGHVILCFTTITRNPVEMKFIQPENFIFFATNMMPNFVVNGFFTITGILTTYFIFTSSHLKSLMSDYRKWLALIMHRYARIMPTYIVVVAFTKYLAKYTGSGPYWDYGTSSNSPRRQCEEESWLWTLLFSSNFKPVLEQCIPSSWYLANDFQFFLVTPIFMTALYKYPNFGQKLLKLCIAAGTLAGVFSIVLCEAYDLKPIKSFMVHGFKTYVTFLAASYTHPQYRIPAYLCGLLLGYKLYIYEQAKLTFSKNENSTEKMGSTQIAEEPHWFNWIRNNGSNLSLLGLLSAVLLPTLGIIVNSDKFLTKVLLGIAMSSYHVIFSLSIGIYILLAATGHGNKSVNGILSAPLWKPLSRLSLCVVLTNLEVCSYLMRTNTQSFYMDFKSHTAINILCIVCSYLAATVLCVLFEYPLKSIINNVMTYVASKSSRKEKCY